MREESDNDNQRARTLRAYASWRHAQSRYERLQAAFDRPECIAAAIARDRYIPLCGQIARASESAETARDRLVILLRDTGPLDG